jgi:purine-nucleoside phosphorylase
LNGRAPKLAFVLGSGLGGLTGEVTDAVRISYHDLPHFPESGVSGHSGEVVAGKLAGHPVMMLSGRIHYYEAGNPAAMRPILEVLCGVGITSIVLTNSAGSLRDDMPPGSVMMIEDHINFSGTNPLFGEPDDRRFVGMTEAYDARMRKIFEKTSEKAKIDLKKGVYMWFSGPSFETPAEIRMARMLGADAVGMSTVPEVILARFFGMRVAACSVITNFAAGMTGAELSHEETKDMAPEGGAKLGMLFKHAIGELA